MIEDKYRKRFIEDFSKRFEIDLENRVIEHYMYEVIKEKDQIIEDKNKVINEVREYIENNTYFEGNAVKTMIYQDYSKGIIEILEKENK